MLVEYPCWLNVVLHYSSICDLSTSIIEGRTSATQITGAGFKREREQQRGRFASHVVKSVLASSDGASRETGRT